MGLENARVENDGQNFSKLLAKLRGLENAGLENDGQNFSKLLAKLRGLENAGLENDGQTFSKLLVKLRVWKMQDRKMTDKLLANCEHNYGV